jgi:GNAT superfamily N-acetyltransferase
VEQTYVRIPFRWSGRQRGRRAADPPGVTWRSAGEVRGLARLVADVLAESVDASDRVAVATLGADGAAARILSPPSGYSHRAAWWRVLLDGGTPAGFVLPVTFDGCEREGLDEGTIYHMGVAPVFRGRGYGRLLLQDATTTLVEHGVWRIHCDTAAANGPMIHLFETEGWTRLAAEERSVGSP